MNDTSPKMSLLMDENVALLTFRRLKKILIVSFLVFFVCLTVAITVLIIYLVRTQDSTSEDHKPTLLNPALQAFCFVASNTSSCIKMFDPIVSAKSVSDPNQIFTLSLQKAVKELKNIIPLLPSNTIPSRDGKETVTKFKNCSISLRNVLSQIRDTLRKMRANPFVEAQSDEQRAEMVYWITAAEENLDSCIHDLATDESGVRAAVLGVKAYVNGGRDFLLRFADVLQMFWIDNGSADWGIINLENLFGICVGGLELFFVVFMFYTLCTTR
ncbi:hypothetical protein Salat_0041900 [Sesamum alatum]|uniref:Pectinesterase inhibitor domain-containing protein n=1 Tax=Sesamum alatum TaxID=300844 RepID=A0AAE1YV49_9LAMI|nr:hypothetical protein Salat_0041900 [Sesamum alatum]